MTLSWGISIGAVFHRRVAALGICVLELVRFYLDLCLYNPCFVIGLSEDEE